MIDIHCGPVHVHTVGLDIRARSCDFRILFQTSDYHPQEREPEIHFSCC
jgi:hypothetical protein